MISTQCQKIINFFLDAINKDGIGIYGAYVSDIADKIINDPKYAASFSEEDLRQALIVVRQTFRGQGIAEPPMAERELYWATMQQEAAQAQLAIAPQQVPPPVGLGGGVVNGGVSGGSRQAAIDSPGSAAGSAARAKEAINRSRSQAPNSSGIQTTMAEIPMTSSGERLHTTPVDGADSDYQRRGEAIVALMNRVKGSPVMKWKGCSLGPRVEVHQLVLADDGKSEIKMPSDAIYSEWQKNLKHKQMIPKGTKVVFRECYGHISMEIPHWGWQPIPFRDNPWIREAHKEWGKQRPLPFDAYQIWCGVDEENELFELNLDEPATAAHIGIAGSTGGGKNGVAAVIICGSTYRYQPSFVKFVLVDTQEVNFQFYETYSPYLWGGLGILSLEEEITRVFGFSNSEDKPQGLIFTEAERRKALFRRAKVDNIRSYNRVAYGYFLAWCKQVRIDPNVIGAIDRYNLEISLNSKLGLPILERIAILIDEIAAVGSLYANSKRSFDDWIRKICQELRKFGFHFVGMTQDPTADADGSYKSETRSQFGNLIGTACNREEVSERAIAKGFTACTELGGNGDTYVLTPTLDEPRRVQWFWVSPEEIQERGLALSANDTYQAARTLYSRQQQKLLEGISQSHAVSFDASDRTEPISFSEPLNQVPAIASSTSSSMGGIALSDSERTLWALVQQKFVILMGLESNNKICLALFGNTGHRNIAELKAMLLKLTTDPRAQQLYQKIESRTSK